MRTCSFAALSVLLIAASAQAMVIVNNKQPVATIVVTTNNTFARSAADLIQHCVRRSSGATLPIVTAGKRPKGPTIQIGHTAAVLAACPEASKLKTDGIIVRVQGGNLCLAAQNSYALKIAAVRFLEETLGVRWLFPGTLGEIVPPHDTIRVADNFNLREEPDLASRMFSGLYGFDPALMRLHLTDHFHHNLYNIVPPAKYAKTHPEYFPMIDGKRIIPTRANSGWQPETTNPAVVQLAVQAADKWFTDHPEETSYSLGVTDGGGESYSPADVALDKQLGPPTPTNRFFYFYDEVAREVAKKWPHKLLGILNYPPLHGVPTVKLAKNLLIYCWRGSDGGKRPAQWYGKWPHLGFCDWLYGCFYCMPRHYPHAYAKLIRYYVKGGFHGMYAEAYPNWPMDGPKLYALSRVMWKLNTNVSAAVSEYLRLAYGPAAPAAERFFAIAEKVMDRRQPPDVFSKWSSNIRQDYAIWTVADVANLEQAVQAMEAAVADQPDSDYARRVELFREGWDWDYVHLRMATGAQALAAMEPHSEAQATQMLTTADELVQLPAQRDKLWNEVVSKQKDMLWCTPNYRQIISASDPSIEIRPSVFTALERIDEFWGAGAAAKWQAAGRKYPHLASYIRIRELLAAPERQTNLIVNPGFEQGLKGWGSWQRPGTQVELRVDGKVARGGKQSAYIGAGLIACYLQDVQVKPGEAFYLSCWVRRASDNGSCALKIWWKSPPGKNLPAIPQWEAQAGKRVGEWQKLELYGAVPQTAGVAEILLLGQNFGAGDGCWFDDVEFVAVPQGKD